MYCVLCAQTSILRIMLVVASTNEWSNRVSASSITRWVKSDSRICSAEMGNWSPWDTVVGMRIMHHGNEVQVLHG